jgi:hypothetical protein
LKTVSIRVSAPAGGTLQLRTAGSRTAVLAEIKLSVNAQWQVVNIPLSASATGIQHLQVALKDGKDVQVDWLRFK